MSEHVAIEQIKVRQRPLAGGVVVDVSYGFYHHINVMCLDGDHVSINSQWPRSMSLYEARQVRAMLDEAINQAEQLEAANMAAREA